ncbi:MAG: glycerate kinase [Tannerellaceae bacterium]
MKKIVIAVDSFKGCLPSPAIAEAASAGIQTVFPSCQIVKIPFADGGEGTVQVLTQATNGQLITTTVNNPLMEPIEATYGILGDQRTAIIEMAAASGLTLIPREWGNVMHTTTYGTGQLIAHAIKHGCQNILLGIGGSATNDAGLGLLQALGFRLLDESGNELGQGGKMMIRVAKIEANNILPELSTCTFRVMTDVNNPFSGPDGAAWVFGTQKGGNQTQLKRLDKGMKHLAQLILETTGRDIDNMPGAGAGGGTAGGCVGLLGATISQGSEVIKDYIDFDNLVSGADLLITGEGKMDAQTLQEKAPLSVLHTGIKQHIPVIAITGNIGRQNNELLMNAGFSAIFPILSQPTSLAEAIQPERSYYQIQRTVEQICRAIRLGEGG